MRFPKPSLQEYAEFTATVLLIIVVLQYTGLFTENPGELNWSILIGTILVLPICTYLWTVLAENIRWLPNWDRMNRTERQ